jgi:DNA-binding NarL/FixJ family response regulator
MIQIGYKRKRTLSVRQLQIARLLAKGCTNLEIVANLGLAKGTIKNYILVIQDKLRLKNRVQIAVWYVTEGKYEKPPISIHSTTKHISLQ